MQYTINFKEIKMSFSDVEHVMTMMSGCESLLHGDPKSADAKYAFTVLKLHANDAGFVAGQEGFIDSIKKGASATVEWVKKLIQAIRDYLKGVSREDRDRINNIDKKLKALEKVEQYNGADAFDGVKGSAALVLKRLEGVAKDVEGTDISFPDVGALVKKMENLIEYMDGDSTKDFHKKVDSLLGDLNNAITSATSSLDKSVSGKKGEDKSLTDSEKFASTALKNLVSAKEAFSRFIDKYIQEVTNVYDRFKNKLEDQKGQHESLTKEKARLEKKN